MPEEKELELQNWKEVLDQPFPSVGLVDEKTRQKIASASAKFRSSVRLALGLVITTEELEAQKARVAKLF